MTLENNHNISARWLTYGIVVQDNEDSGWKITGKSPGLLDEKCYRLEAFTSAGQASETWAQIFENGYGYFGKLEDEAVFAHFYRSDVKSARGRYFVPRSILLLPIQEYINRLQCNPLIVFAELSKHKGTSTGNITEVTQLAPLQIPVPPGEHEITPVSAALENIPGKLLIDTLCCLLQPEPLETIIWSGEKPETEILFSLLFLLPLTLRKFVTFCTCVENPENPGPRVKIVKDLPTNFKNNSLIIIKDKKIELRWKRTHWETPLPGILVNAFKQGGNLNTLHHLIDSEPGLLYETNFEAALRQTERLSQRLNQKSRIEAATDPKTKYRELIAFGTGLKNIEEEREFIVAQMEKSLPGFKTAESPDNEEQLALLTRMLIPEPGMAENDMPILIGELTKGSSTLENPDFFRDVLAVVSMRYKGESLSRYLHLLLTLAKEFIRKSDKYRLDMEYHIVKILEKSWQPQGINEVKEIYRAVSFCFDIVTIHKVLEIGLSRCFKNDKKKEALILYLLKMVKDIAVLADNDDLFEMILNNIKDSKNQYYSIDIEDFSIKARKKYEGYKTMVGIIDTELKKMKKAK
jgi:hypothetical protein